LRIIQTDDLIVLTLTFARGESIQNCA